MALAYPVLSSLATELAEKCARGKAVAGAAIGLRGLATMFAQWPAASFAKFFGPSLCAGIGISVQAAAALLIALASKSGSLALFQIAQLLSGTGASLEAVARQIVVLKLAPESVRGRALALYGGLMRAASTVGPAIGVCHKTTR